MQESEYIPAYPLRAPLSSWRIRFKKVLRTLQQLDVNKRDSDRWASRFIPQSQFGFVKGCGTTDYGSALSSRSTTSTSWSNETRPPSFHSISMWPDCGGRVRSSVVGQAQGQVGGQRHEWQGTAFDQRLHVPTRGPHSSRDRWQIVEQERGLLGCTARSKVVAQVN